MTLVQGYEAGTKEYTVQCGCDVDTVVNFLCSKQLGPIAVDELRQEISNLMLPHMHTASNDILVLLKLHLLFQNSRYPGKAHFDSNFKEVVKAL